MIKTLIKTAICAAAIFIVGCTDSANKVPEDAIAKVGKSVLTASQVADAVPSGLSQSDSLRYAAAYINRWIDNTMLSELASVEIDMDEIDRLTDEYRNRLIRMEYSRQMFDSPGSSPVDEDSVRSYYEQHKADFTLQRPLIKGLYLKVPENSKNLSTIRRLYRSDKQADTDRLEKEVLSSAIHYDYFRDRWVDWEQIELHVPYDFGNDADGFLRAHDHFETSAGGFVYLLDIVDVLPSGSIMPLDNARKTINDILLAGLRRQHEASILDQLYKKSLKDGKIQLFVDIDR